MADLRPVYVAGDGDVKGPASSSNNFLPLFADVTGKQLKSSGTGVTAQGLAILDDNTPAEQRNTIGLGQVNNTSDINKPVSTSQQNALNLKANKGANSDITSITGLTTALAVNQGGTGSFEPYQAKSNLFVPGKNRLINGGMVVAQRGFRDFTNNQIGYAGPDRFLCLNNNAGGTIRQSATTMLFDGITYPCVRQQAIASATDLGAVSNHWAGVCQRIEGYNIYDLSGKPMAISFLFRASLTGNYSVRVNIPQGSSTLSYIYKFAAVSGVAIKVKFNIPAQTFNTTPNNSVGMLVGVAGIGYNANVCTSTVGTWLTATSGYLDTPDSVNWAVTGNTVDVTNFQLEEGVASEFERLSIQQDVAACQRYFESISLTTCTNNMNWVWWRYAVQKRATCTVSLIAGAMNGVTVYPQDFTGFRTSGQATNDVDASFACDAEL